VNPTEPLKVLLVEDDEDDFILAKGLFSEMQGRRCLVEWMKTFATGLETMARNQHDVCLVDYRLGAENGITLLRAALECGCKAPIILLTGQGEHEIDLEAMKAGAADYLVKGRLDAGLLERSIRYAIERRRAADLAASEQARLAAFGEDIGLALSRRDALESILQRCATAMVHYLNAALARLWIYEPEETALKLYASAGTVDDGGAHARQQPKIVLDMAQLTEGKPILINRVIGDARVPDQDWVKREGIVAYAGYPLLLEDRLVGLMSVFAKNPLTEAILQEMASVANGIALCIERKRSAEALDASEVRYRSVVENIKEVIFQTDQSGQWTFLNPAWTEITGFKVKQTLGTHFADFIHPDDRERHRELIQEVLELRKSYCRDETRYLAADGTFRWMEVYAQPILHNHDHDHVSGITGTLSDITERKRAEAEIQKLAAFPRFSPNPVMELAADGTLTYLNNAAHEMARLLAVDRPEAILPPDAGTVAQECLRQGQSKPPREIQINGRTLSWSFFPIIASQVVHCYGVDVTERLNLEFQLRHAQKLESIGQLAAGVAHDFNNILTIIQGHTDRLVLKCENEPRLSEPLNQVAAAAKRAAGLTQQLLMFSRKQRMQATVLDLNDVIRNLTTMLQRLLGEDIKLESSCASTLPAIEADGGMIEQIIMNLSVNARDAMPKGGKLVIATAPVTIDTSYVQQHPEAHTGGFVCLSVTDTGVGMSKETLSRIFEPFFTTKDVGKGTGLGLATVYGIIKQHQGWVEVSSEVGIGTTFRIYLPASARAVEAAADKNSPKSAVKGGSETILLVEDEPVLRELACLILKDYQYDVLEAASGVEALKVFERHNGQVDLLLTDMVMPEGMTGRELAEQLKSRKPELKVVYTSGYSSDVTGADIGLNGSRFLQKPYAPPLLAKTVRECLDVAA
jgi:PAS domain S-box-containing protein